MTPSSPHILWLTEHFPPGQGGMAESCARIVDSLRDGGLKLTLVHLTGRPGQDRLEPAATGQTLLFSRDADPAHTLLRLWERLERLHARDPFTQVVAFGGFLPLLGAPTFAAGWHIPLVVLLRGNDFDTGIFDPLRRPMLLEALSRATGWPLSVRTKPVGFGPSCPDSIRSGFPMASTCSPSSHCHRMKSMPGNGVGKPVIHRIPVLFVISWAFSDT